MTPRRRTTLSPLPTSTPGRALATALVLAGLLPGIARSAAPSAADGAIDAATRNASERRAGTFVELAAAFMLKARDTGDPAYHGRAAAALDRALAIDPDSYEALRARAWVLLAQHDFRGAHGAAERARALRPDDWWNHATLADAAVELGDYAGAEEAAQQLLDLRPGLPAYTRVAYLRTLFGDRDGAIEMLERAARAGSGRDPEALAWTLVHLGHEHFAAGALGAAGPAYARALDVLPGYPLALAGLGRVRAAEGRSAEAVDLYRRALAAQPSPELAGALGDLHAARGETDEAERHYALVDHMERVAEAAGKTYGRQLALFHADHDRRLGDALRLARKEAATRGDVYTDDAVAWALHKNGRPAEAMRAAHRALRLGTRDALLHYHAGMIAAALDRPRRAARHLGRALALNPYFDLRQAAVARTTLARLHVAEGDHR